MSRKHFRAIAEAIYAEYDNACTPEARAAIERVAEHLALVIGDFNGRFDADRFLRAALKGER